jgi:hypothetical protein
VPPFRRSATAPRRRRRSRALLLLGRASWPAAALALPCLAAFWVLTSPLFALADVEVEAAGRVPASWVRQSLAPWAGANLPALPLAEVERRLAAHPWVAGMDLKKELPGRLVVALVERRPAAVVARGAAFLWTDESGNLIAPLAAAEAPPPLPLVREDSPWLWESSRVAPGVPGALAVLAELERAQPAWARGLVEIGVLSPQDFRIETAALPFPILVEAGAIEAKARRLARLLPEILVRYEELEAVDLRFSRRIILRPAPTPEENHGG